MQKNVSFCCQVILDVNSGVMAAQLCEPENQQGTTGGVGTLASPKKRKGTGRAFLLLPMLQALDEKSIKG